MPEHAHSATSRPRHGQTAPTGVAAFLARWWARPTAAFAFALSLFLHAVLLLIAAVIFLDLPTGRGGGASGAGAAVTSSADLSSMAATALSSELPQSAEQRLELPTDATTDAEALTEGLSPLKASELGQLGGSGDVTAEGGSGVFSGGSGAASFFGVEARGTRFAFILDVSGSMTGERFERLKYELFQSIDGLLEQTSFTIVLYNSEGMSLTNGKWLEANPRYKSLIKRQVESVTPTGGTNPMPAFERVFAMKPRPDAIYFMTDGVFADNIQASLVDAVDRMNLQGRSLSAIHCITFIEDASAPLMREIARRSDGTYTHIPGGRP